MCLVFFLEARGTQGGPGGLRGKPGEGYPAACHPQNEGARAGSCKPGKGGRPKKRRNNNPKAKVNVKDEEAPLAGIILDRPQLRSTRLSLLLLCASVWYRVKHKGNLQELQKKVAELDESR